MSIATKLASRRSIVGLIGLLASAPRASAAQAAEVVRSTLFESDELQQPRDVVGRNASREATDDDPIKWAMERAYREVERAAEARCYRLQGCRSMSPAAKRAYQSIARDAVQPAYIKWAKIMGYWVPPEHR